MRSRHTEQRFPVAGLLRGGAERELHQSKRPPLPHASRLVRGFSQGHEQDWTVRPGQWGRFLYAVFDEWVRADVGRVFVQHFDVALEAWAGFDPGLCVHARTCGLCLAMEYTGDVFACDHYVAPEYSLGNILRTPLRELATSPFQCRFGQAKRDALPGYCRRCPVLAACNGGCPKDRFVDTPDGEPGLNYLSEGYRMFFTHVRRQRRAQLFATRPSLVQDALGRSLAMT